jgi:crotonobetainyl-CoA:carnitine CoA-transferase CaiB-like acyl-CoA transferase
VSGPLQGTTVVELGQMIAVPGATHLLATQGAEVVKVENLAGGDDLRRYGSSKNGMSGWFANANAGKRAIAVDLESDDGREVLLRLVDRADVFAQGYRAGAVERLGIGYDVASARNPRLVYLSASGFGSDGPYAERPAYDPIIQALTGWASSQRTATGEPSLVRGMVADKVAALVVAQAITAALAARGRHGGGQHVTVSMLEANLAFTWPDVMMDQTLLDDDASHRPNLLQGYRVFPCADGWVSVGAGTDEHWLGLCTACRRADIAADERFATPASRAASFTAWYDAIAEMVAPLPRQEVLDRCIAAGVPIAPVYERSEIVDDPQVAARGAVRELDHPVVGRYRSPRQGARFGRDVADEPRPAPSHGEHTDEILAELGYGPAQVRALRDGAVVV